MDLRNIAIIAHVDHGKTTLVDQLLKQSGAVRDNQQVAERAMDSNDLERERGITILAKATSVDWKGMRINIVDTPGHADFGGEVERILSMVDGVVLLVDAAESVMPQTKFVLSKALKLGLKPIVVVNKIDRSDARTEETHDHIVELFLALDANDDQLDFRTLYASGRQGWAVTDLKDERKDLTPLFETIVEVIPPPKPIAKADGYPFSMLVTILEADPFLGRVLTGRIETGKLTLNQPIKSLTREGKLIERGRATKILAFRGLDRRPIEEAQAGDIIAIAGLTETTVADTICDQEVETPIPATPIDPPTLSITISVNDSPLAGREGSKVQSRVIRARLMREAEGNVAIKVKDSDIGDSFEVSGRGELQLGVLIEQMRREGFELSISRPQVIYREGPNGERLEPIEEVIVDVDEPYAGVVIEKISMRKGEMQDLRHTGAGKVRITFHAPSRGLIGYHGEFLTDTRGTGVMNRIFHEYGPYRGPVGGRRNGVLISTADGETVTYALWYLEERGKLFVTPGTKAYQGMIVGEHSRDNDLDVNPLKTKQLTNIRTTQKDEAIKLTPVQQMTLEQAIAYIEQDELVEVTPQSIRLRKKMLLPHERKRQSQKEAAL
ncbi:MAG: translational GTPase TypA [Alphaproteobacteria bacterium]